MLRILLVNDTPRHFGRLREGLEKAGYCVVGESSDAFLLPRQVAALQPDVIIVDTESPRDTLIYSPTAGSKAADLRTSAH